MNPRPTTPSQISYAQHLVDQAVRGLRGIPGWLPKNEAPSPEEIAALDGNGISELIDTLKARKPFTVRQYGNGTAQIKLKSASAFASAERVAARYLRTAQ